MGVAETFSALRLVQSRHVVPALLAALDSEHEALKVAAVNALIASNDEPAHRALILRFDELPLMAQSAMVDSVHALRAVLADVARDGDGEARGVVLRLLELNVSYECSETLAELLSDPVTEYADRAEEAFRRVVERYQSEQEDAAGDLDTGSVKKRERLHEHARHLFRAFKLATESFFRHRREFVLEGALNVGGDCRALVTDALRAEREANRDEPGPVERFLVARHDVRVLAFLFERLSDHRVDIRAIALRAFGLKRGQEVNVNFGYLLDEQVSDEDLRKMLITSGQVPFLSMMQGHVDRYPPRALRRLMHEFSRLNMPGRSQAEFYGTLCESRDQSIAEDCFARLRALPLGDVQDLLSRLVTSRRQSSVRFAFEQMADRGHPGALQAATRLIESRFTDVRDLASTFVARRAYDRYVERFESMSEADRRAAGAVLRHVDDGVIEELRREIDATEPAVRLRALRLLDCTHNAHRMGETLLALMNDPDARVRASVVNMLATLRSEAAIRAIGRLLGDEDKRVRANAIEAVEALGERGLARALIPYLSDANNRIRGNAAKALYNLGVEEAAQIMKAMLHDGSELMRMSGVWAIRETSPPGAEQWLAERRAIEPLESINTRIDAALARLAQKRAQSPALETA